MDPKGRDVAGYRMHAFVCGHTRPEGSSRGCCSEKNSLDLMKEFKRATKEKGIADVRVQKSGCLDFCENGIACVVYPEGTWYRLTPKVDVKSLIENLKNDTIDDDLPMRFDE